MPKTERKIKNNYVICKEGSTERRETLMVNMNHNQQTNNTEISKLHFSRIMAIGKGGFGKVWKV